MTSKTPPHAKKSPKTIVHHDIRHHDDYAWLRADNWRDAMRSPEQLPADIRQYIDAENDYTQSAMEETEALQATLFNEMKGRIEQDERSVPNIRNDYQYYTRYQTDKQYPIFCRTPIIDDTAEQVLLDGNREAERHPYFDIGDLQNSPDHQSIAYTIDTDGSEFYALHIRNLSSSQQVDTAIEHVQGDIVWSNDSQYLFYIALDDDHRPHKVYRHRVGTDCADDVVVHHEKDNSFFIHIDKTSSQAFINIAIHAHQTTECHLLAADDPCGELSLVRERQSGIEYFVEHHDSGLLIKTNSDGAKDYKVVHAPNLNAPWNDFYVPPSGVLLEDFMVFESWWVRNERCDGLSRIVISPLRSDSQPAQEHTIAFDEACYELSLEDNEQYQGNTLRFTYSSMTTPRETYDYDMQDHSRLLRKQQVIPSGHDPQNYVSQRLFARADDGETIPISILYAKQTPPTARSPLLLYAYGAYGHATSAAFSTTRLSLVDRGFVFAIAHVRGGMEKGYHWYENGKMEHKKNTFYDFIACAQHLITQGLTSSDKIAIYGGSAGGMLIGAVLNMRPELFAAAIADVPFVDVLNTMLDDSLPLTPPEWVEWGNPIKDRDAYQYIASYSPYDNVHKARYPHILVTAGISDPRVTYWEPAKWVAHLRANKQDQNLLLLKTNMGAGHAGQSGRYDALKEVAFKYAFLIKSL